jgi:hypothetical protein
MVIIITIIIVVVVVVIVIFIMIYLQILQADPRASGYASPGPPGRPRRGGCGGDGERQDPRVRHPHPTRHLTGARARTRRIPVRPPRRNRTDHHHLVFAHVLVLSSSVTGPRVVSDPGAGSASMRAPGGAREALRCACSAPRGRDSAAEATTVPRLPSGNCGCHPGAVMGRDAQTGNEFFLK